VYGGYGKCTIVAIMTFVCVVIPGILRFTESCRIPGYNKTTDSEDMRIILEINAKSRLHRKHQNALDNNSYLTAGFTAFSVTVLQTLSSVLISFCEDDICLSFFYYHSLGYLQKRNFEIKEL
jgi:hypothetical protein